MFGLKFNPFTSKTMGAILLAVVTVLVNQAQQPGGITKATIGLCIAAVLGVLGIRDAIAANGPGATAAEADKSNGIGK